MANDWKNVQYKDGKYRTSEGGGGGGSSTFADLDDVNFSNLQNGQVPKYNSTTQKWENANESGGGGTVTDVEVDGVSVVNQQGVAEIETPNAGGIEYDNQQSGLQATDVQSAIDELAQGSGGGGVEDVKVNGTSVVNAQNVAEITSYKEVTLAEYQALPSSKLTDGIMYCIKDVGGANQFPPLIYSDEEREVGVWRDGKPLYAKTINLPKSVLTSKDMNIQHGISNLDKIIDISGVMRADNQNPIVTGYQWGSDWGCSIGDVTSTTFYLRMGGSRYSAVTEVSVTLLYTKTTDTAGSGTWTTQGGYAHHYIADEHIIGTLLGKPLYEKTMTFLKSDFSNVRQILNHNISNLEYMYKMEGVMIANNQQPLTTGFDWGSQYGCGIGDISDTTFQINIGTSRYSSLVKVIVTMQYTKTTD